MNRSELFKKAGIADTLISIFTLMLDAGESNRREASEMIRKLSPEARRNLRAACQALDELIDDVILREMAEKRPWKL